MYPTKVSSVWQIVGSSIAFPSFEEAKRFQAYCNAHQDLYAYVDDGDIVELNVCVILVD